VTNDSFDLRLCFWIEIKRKREEMSERQISASINDLQNEYDLLCETEVWD
jgi:hypothetical protein